MSLRATVRMARAPRLGPVVRADTAQRVAQSLHYAMLEICRGRAGDHRPGRAAVAGVATGRYTSLMCVGTGSRSAGAPIERRRRNADRLPDGRGSD